MYNQSLSGVSALAQKENALVVIFVLFCFDLLGFLFLFFSFWPLFNHKRYHGEDL